MFITKPETIVVSKEQVFEMYTAQLAVKQTLNNGRYAKASIESSIKSTQASVLGLLFLKRTAPGVAAGISSLAFTANSLQNGAAASLADQGFYALSNLYFIMNERGYVRANITVVRIFEHETSDTGIIKSLVTNTLTKGDGIVITQ